MERAPSLPPNVRLPDPKNVVLALARRGYRVQVWFDPQYGPMHLPGAVPDAVWLQVLAEAGMHPLPCLGCYSTGAGNECIAGRCSKRSPSGLILPPT